MAEPLVEIEVVYAAVDRQVLMSLAVAPGSTLRAAVLGSGMAAQFPELNLQDCPLGIFGKAVADADVRVVQAGDRIEIYRPLLADPMEIRRFACSQGCQGKTAEFIA